MRFEEEKGNDKLILNDLNRKAKKMKLLSLAKYILTRTLFVSSPQKITSSQVVSTFFHMITRFSRTLETRTHNFRKWIE